MIFALAMLACVVAVLYRLDVRIGNVYTAEESRE